MTTKPIGLTFASEIAAAGLLGLPFSWGDDGSFHFDATMTAEQVRAVQTVYAAHDPSRADNRTVASAMLDKADIVMHRVAEAIALGLSSWTALDVVAWVNYRRALRTIVGGAISNVLPAAPPYPHGT